MSIDTDIELIDNAESGETVRSAIIRVIEDLNQNGGNAQTLNGHDSDAFTKKTEFDNFVDNEVGAIHQVLDAINKGTTLKVIDLEEHEIGPAAGTLRITVPRSISDRSLLTVDDFYADIVSVAGGNGANANWTKSATYDSVSGIYSYSYGALATKITLHFYVKRASAIAVTDYDVHHLANDITSNGPYSAPAGEAWDFVNVQVPGSKTETTLEANENRTYEQPQQSNEVWNKVIVNVPAPTPSLQEGEVTVRQPSYDTTFTPTSPNVGFSSFRVKAEVPEPVVQRDKAVTLTTNNTTVNVTPDAGKDVMDSVAVTVQVPEQSIETGRSVTYSSGGTYTVNPSGDYDAMDSVEVTVQTPRLQPSKSVTLSQSGTITPDPNFDAMEEVVVTVSGGGGDCNIMDKSTWDAMSFADKKRSGLTVIKNNEYDTTGYWFDYSDIAFPLTIECELYDSGHKSVNIPAMTRAIVFQGIYNNGIGNYDNIELASPLMWSYDYRSDYNKVTPIGSENPHNEGWYELSTGGNRTYNVTSDTTVNLSKTYYTKEDPNMIEVYYRSTDTSKMIFDSMVTIFDNTSAASIYYENGYNGDTSYSVYGAIISIDDVNADISILGEYYDGNVHTITTDTDYDAIICITTKASQRANFNGQIDVVGTYASKFDGDEKLYNDSTKSCISVYYGVESGAVITAYPVQDTPGYTRQVGSAIIGVKANNS
ncbi:hypothetical protein [Pseudobutyrivibrio sp.]|uniref:hypothetical protein n=1 Tax=Pseudobutyrivibrio sp. TaxID=2014367 RepID=UPI00386BD7F8